MFVHSVRVPRLYKLASKIIKEVSEGKGSIKQLVYEGLHPNIKGLFALVVHTFQKTDDVENLLKKSKFLVKEPRIDPWLAKVLIAELLWGKKVLSGNSKPVKTVLAYEQIFKAHLSDIPSNDFPELAPVYKPRYVRINTLKTTINEAIETFRNEGWFLKRHTNSDDYPGFLEAVCNLGPEEFMVDLHIPYLLIFPPRTEFYQHKLYKDGTIILQDKASCLPVHILNPEPGSVVLDMCAAPGMKTTQCAALMQNSGKIHAVEIGQKRYGTLKEIVNSAGATCVKTINADALRLPFAEYKDVEYILVDPSCSGSGITDRVEIGQQEKDRHKNRLEKLAGLQIKMLRTALFQFPKAKRVVYSTCSLYPEENEDVVRQVLETCFYYKLVPATQFIQNKWLNFGSSEFGELGTSCLYSKPDIDLTSGFFVAVFERLEEGERNQFLNQSLYLKKMQNRAKREVDNAQGSGFEEIPQELVDVSKIKKEKKRKRGPDPTENVVSMAAENINDRHQDLIHKKKKKKKSDDEASKENLVDKGQDTDKENNDLVEDAVCKKKKKKGSTGKNSLAENVEVKSGNNQTCTVNEDSVHKKKKGKEKKNVDFIKTEVDYLQTESEKESKKEKKKKKKHEHVDKSTENINIEVKDTGDNFQIETKEESQKKKIKKEKQSKDLDKSNGTEDFKDAVDNPQIRIKEESQKKKKKKETQCKDLDESNETGYLSVAGDNLQTGIKEESSKKKKNREKLTKDLDASNKTEYLSVTVENLQREIEEESPKNKKKKDRLSKTFNESNETENVTVQVDDTIIDENEEPKQKKKKKRDKQKNLEESNETENVTAEINDTGIDKKKKNILDQDMGIGAVEKSRKRKRSESNKDIETSLCDDQTSEKPHKKKKKTK